jgi:hypothetical protein
LAGFPPDLRAPSVLGSTKYLLDWRIFMSLTPGMLNDTTARLNKFQEIAADQSEDIVTNVRWLATLVLAEVAGLAKYREQLGQHTLSVPFALVIIGLCLALVCFVGTIIIVRQDRTSLGVEAQKSFAKIADIANDPTVPFSVGDPKVLGIVEAWWKIAQEKRLPQKWEMVGIGIFGAASVLAAVVIFLGEIIALFHG